MVASKCFNMILTNFANNLNKCHLRDKKRVITYNKHFRSPKIDESSNISIYIHIHIDVA